MRFSGTAPPLSVVFPLGPVFYQKFRARMGPPGTFRRAAPAARGPLPPPLGARLCPLRAALTRLPLGRNEVLRNAPAAQRGFSPGPGFLPKISRQDGPPRNNKLHLG